VRQIFQNYPKVNGNGAKWKQLVDRAEADRHTLCKFLDGQVISANLIRMQQLTGKWETAFNQAAWNWDKKMLCKQKKQMPKERQKL
jgi:hypothetical protein